MITREDMVTRFGTEEIAALTDHENNAAINDEVLNKALSDADEEVKSYLAAAGIKGLAIWPKALVIKACDIARYYLYENGVTQIVEDRYKQAIAWLREVARNPRMLGLDEDENMGGRVDWAVRPNNPEPWNADFN